jgi:DNA (cytosine-5)-methyltransferase 1
LCLKTEIPENFRYAVDNVIKHGDRQKGVLTVLITGFVYKYYHPEQDVRFHQSNMAGGYSGRSFDSKYITPFMRNNGFPAMAESGWLTRSLEQNVPYKEGYTGKISGKELKDSFLLLYSATEKYDKPIEILAYLFQQLVKRREDSKIRLSIPANLTVLETLNLIKRHFEYGYKNIAGASRLPNLAIYSAYKSIIDGNQARYRGKTLCDLGSHTATDSSIGVYR